MKNKHIITLLLSLFFATSIRINAQSDYLNKNDLKTIKMDTRRSDKIVEKYQKQEIKMLRKTREFNGIINASPEKVFPLLCSIVSTWFLRTLTVKPELTWTSTSTAVAPIFFA